MWDQYTDLLSTYGPRRNKLNFDKTSPQPHRTVEKCVYAVIPTETQAHLAQACSSFYCGAGDLDKTWSACWQHLIRHTE